MKKSIYFPNLNGLRFFAAFIVICTHFAQLNDFGKIPVWDKYFSIVGRLGVILFFTLSGFLITYLLLAEKKETGSIHVKKFYIRRILRIWPLYYLIIIGALYIFNNVMYLRIPGASEEALKDNFFLKNVLYLGMLPNVAYALGYVIPYTIQAWSIGVEEQFYLIWPLLFRKINNSLKLLLTIIAGYLFLKITFFLLNMYFANGLTQVLNYFIRLLCFDSMAIGGIAAVLLFNNNKYLEILFSKWIQFICFGLLAIFLAIGINFGLFQYEIYSILYAVIILNLAGNKKVVLNLDNSLLNFLGKISYGLYMYHFISIRIGDLLETKYPIFHIMWLKFVIVLLITIFISTISYEFFEKYFIRKKTKFSLILSGDNSKQSLQ